MLALFCYFFISRCGSAPFFVKNALCTTGRLLL